MGEECLSLNSMTQDICSNLVYFKFEQEDYCRDFCSKSPYAILRSGNCMCISSVTYVALNKSQATSCDGGVIVEDLRQSDCLYSATEPKKALLYSRLITNYDGIMHILTIAIL